MSTRPARRLRASSLLGVTLYLAACGEPAPFEPAPADSPAAPMQDGGTLAAAVSNTNLWSFKAPLATGRQSPGGAVVNNVIYVVGGYNGGVTLTSM
jgi:hypothetical protein